PVNCPVCAQVHLVDPKTTEVLGAEEHATVTPRSALIGDARRRKIIQDLRNSSGSFAIFAAIRLASSLVRRLVGAVHLNGLTACAETISPRGGAKGLGPPVVCLLIFKSLSSITPLLQRRMTQTARPGSRTQWT